MQVKGNFTVHATSPSLGLQPLQDILPTQLFFYQGQTVAQKVSPFLLATDYLQSEQYCWTQTVAASNRLTIRIFLTLFISIQLLFLKNSSVKQLSQNVRINSHPKILGPKTAFFIQKKRDLQKFFIVQLFQYSHQKESNLPKMVEMLGLEILESQILTLSCITIMSFGEKQTFSWVKYNKIQNVYFTNFLLYNFIQSYMKDTSRNRVQWLNHLCCICGNSNCFQSVDHTQILLPELETVLNEAKQNLEEVNEIKNRIKNTYIELKDIFIQKLENDEKDFQQWTNQFYFTYLNGKVNMNLVCKLAQKNYSPLPNKSLYSLIKKMKLQNIRARSGYYFHQKLSSIQKFLDKFDSEKIVQKSLRYLGGEFITNGNTSSLASSKVGSSILSRLEQSEIIPQTYQWKNVKLNNNSRVAQLSNKNLKDQDLIKQLPLIGCFRNLKEFQVRNNFITALSCRVIVNNLSFIQSLDVRGNKIGDTGVQIIAKGLSRLKSLLISDTETTDKGGRLIGELMSNLQLFWAENNKIRGEVILTIASKPKLKVMSASGNPIDEKHKSLLYQIFLRKGYVVL